MRNLLQAVLGTAIVVLLAACSGRGAPEADLLIADVTLIDGTGAAARSHVDVYVRDGRIADIAAHPGGKPARQVVDGAGKYLIPGLIDAHTHPFPVERTFPRFIRFGVTSIFITGCSDCSNETLSRLRSDSRSDRITAPRVFHTSQHFTMEGRHPVKTYVSDKWIDGETVHFLRDTLQIGRLVREVAREPILGIKVTIEEGPAPPFVERMPAAFVAAIVREAHRHGLKVFAHVSDMAEVRIAADAGVDHLLHFVGVDIDWERDAAVIERLRQRNLSWVTTLMIDKSFFYPVRPEWQAELAEDERVNADELARLQAEASPEAAMAFIRGAYGVSDPTFAGIIAPQIDDLRELHARGFPLVIGTDVGNDWIFPGVSIHEEMEIMAMGFDPREIIPMATRNAAAMLGVLDSLGTIEAGKVADMVLLDRDPLADIRHTRSIRAVYKRGTPQAMAGGDGE